MGRPFTQERVDRLRRLTETHGIVQAAAIARTSANAIRKVRKRGWQAATAGGLPKRPRPSDFAIQAAHMTIKEMAVHYRAGHSTVLRWASEIDRPKMSRRRRSGE